MHRREGDVNNLSTRFDICHNPGLKATHLALLHAEGGANTVHGVRQRDEVVLKCEALGLRGGRVETESRDAYVHSVLDGCKILGPSPFFYYSVQKFELLNILIRQIATVRKDFRA